MEKFWRFCRWLRLALVLLLVLGVVGLAFYTHTDGFREFVREKLVTAINASMHGKVSVAKLDGSVWGSLTLIDVSLIDNEAEIVRIPRLKVNYALLPLIWGRIQILRLEAAQPLVWLKEGRDGVWNIVEALSPIEPQSETPSLVVSISSLELQRADIDISFSGNSYRLTGLDLKGTAGMRSDLTTVDLRQVSARVLTKDMPEARVKGALAYEDRGGLESLKFDDFIIESGSSGLRLTGKIDDLKTFETTAKVSIDKLAPADIAHFVPQWPVKTNVSGTANLRGPLTALKGDFSLSVADGSIAGNFQTDVARDSPMYQGSLKITQVNLLNLLERKELRGVVSALIQVNGSGFSLANLAGQGEANIRSTEIAAWNLGDVSLKASLARSEAKTAGSLTSELGHANWQGQIAFKDIPQYELSFSANQLDIQKISAGQTIKGSLNLAGTIKGSGLTPAAMNSLAKIDVQRSTVGGVELEQGALVVSIANQRIRIEQGLLKATDATLSVKGDIGTDPKQQGQLEYQLRVNTLSPWLALVDQQGSGSVNLIGGAKGNLNDLKAQGKLAVRSISFAGTTVQSGSIDYDLGYASTRSLPFGTLNVNLSDIRAGYQMQSLDGVIKILPQTPTAIDLDVKARDAQNRNHAVVARLDYQPGHLLARLARLTLDLPDGTWRLAQPVMLEQRDQDFLVDRLLMRNNGRELFLDGQFSLTGNQALRLNVEKLPLEAMRAFFP
ncbi:MAG TPA: hypothetical protein VI585_06455, partial [Candidatus Binatia bacterium]